MAPAVDEMARLEAIQEMSERAAILVKEQRAREGEEQAILGSINTVWTWWTIEIGETVEHANAFQEQSVRMFLKRGLTLGDLREAIDSTALKLSHKYWMKPDVSWRYFCGTCWKMIRDREGQQ